MAGEQEQPRIISFPFQADADQKFKEMRPDIVVPEKLRQVEDPYRFVMDNLPSYQGTQVMDVIKPNPYEPGTPEWTRANYAQWHALLVRQAGKLVTQTIQVVAADKRETDDVLTLAGGADDEEKPKPENEEDPLPGADPEIVPEPTPDPPFQDVEQTFAAQIGTEWVAELVDQPGSTLSTDKPFEVPVDPGFDLMAQLGDVVVTPEQQAEFNTIIDAVSKDTQLKTRADQGDNVLEVAEDISLEEMQRLFETDPAKYARQFKDLLSKLRAAGILGSTKPKPEYDPKARIAAARYRGAIRQGRKPKIATKEGISRARV